MISRALIAAVVLGAAGVPANADDARVWLVADEDVCDPEVVRARVRELLSRDPFDAAATRTIELGVERTSAGLRASIAMDPGRREIEGATCADLTEAIALVIATVLSGPEPAGVVEVVVEEVVDPTAPVDNAQAVPPELPDPVEREVPSSASPGIRSRPLRFAVLVGVAGGAVAGSTAGAAVLGGRVRGDVASLALELQVAAATSTPIGMGSVSVSSGTIEAAPCLHRGALAGCLTLAGGWVTGSGQALFNPRRATTPLFALGARVAWEHRLAGRVGLRAHLGVRAPLTRNRFLVDDMTVWSNAAVEGWLGLSLVTQIP